MKYKCGHETSGLLVLDGTPTMQSAYLRWIESDKSMCFHCWYDSSKQSITGEEDDKN